MEEGRSGRGRCEEHDLARGPDGVCVLCRRDNAPPVRRVKLHRSLVLLGALTTLCGSVAFARGVVASRAARTAAAHPQVFESHETPKTPPPVSEPTQTAPKPEPVVAPTPSTTANHRLDDAIAALPKTQAAVIPEQHQVIQTPSEVACVCRARAPHPMVNRPYDAWGPDHDSSGHLRTKSRLHTSWGKPLSFDDPAPNCSCPKGTVRVHPHALPEGSGPTRHIAPE